MINSNKHCIQLGTGDVDMTVLESRSGAPVVAFSNSGDGIGKGSVFLGFANGESVDGLISFLRYLRRSYYPQSDTGLSSTQRFRIFADDDPGYSCVR